MSVFFDFVFEAAKLKCIALPSALKMRYQNIANNVRYMRDRLNTEKAKSLNMACSTC